MVSESETVVQLSAEVFGDVVGGEVVCPGSECEDPEEVGVGVVVSPFVESEGAGPRLDDV